jgi:hypothetical protein
MKIIIVVRRTIDYKSMTKDKFLNQKTWSRDTLEQMNQVIETWNDVFKIKYFEFRHHLRSIASSNWISIPKLDMIITNPNTLFKLLPSLTDSYSLLFVDDDDWFNPKISGVLEENINYDAYNWKLQYFITSSRKVKIRARPVFWISSDDHFLTNNYVVTRKGYEKLSQLELDDLASRYWGHEKADETFRASKKFNTTNLNISNLSMTSKSAASVGEIWKLMKKPDKKAALMESLLLATNSFNIPPVYKWATKYIRAVERLYINMI